MLVPPKVLLGVLAVWLVARLPLAAAVVLLGDDWLDRAERAYAGGGDRAHAALVMVAGQLADGTAQLSQGAAQLDDGAGSLARRGLGIDLESVDLRKLVAKELGPRRMLRMLANAWKWDRERPASGDFYMVHFTSPDRAAFQKHGPVWHTQSPQGWTLISQNDEDSWTLHSPLGIGQGAFQGATLFGEVKMPLALVLLANPRLDQTIVKQRPQHTVQRLLGHAQNGQKIAHRGAGAAMDEMHRPVMGAAVIHGFQDAIRIGGKAAIGKEHRLDALANLLVRQKQQAFAPGVCLWHMRLPFAPNLRQAC